MPIAASVCAVYCADVLTSEWKGTRDGLLHFHCQRAGVLGEPRAERGEFFLHLCGEEHRRRSRGEFGRPNSAGVLRGLPVYLQLWKRSGGRREVFRYAGPGGKRNRSEERRVGK